MAPDPRSGLDGDGGFTPVFQGQREPFTAGNDAAVTHGSYSKFRHAPRGREFYEQYADLVPFRTESDGPMLDLLGVTMAQVERAALTLAFEQAESARAVRDGGAPSPRLDRLAADMRSWVSLAAKLLDQLGMSPTARARLAGDLADVQRAVTAGTLRERYAEVVDG